LALLSVVSGLGWYYRNKKIKDAARKKKEQENSFLDLNNFRERETKDIEDRLQERQEAEERKQKVKENLHSQLNERAIEDPILKEFFQKEKYDASSQLDAKNNFSEENLKESIQAMLDHFYRKDQNMKEKVNFELLKITFRSFLDENKLALSILLRYCFEPLLQNNRESENLVENIFNKFVRSRFLFGDIFSFNENNKEIFPAYGFFLYCWDTMKKKQKDFKKNSIGYTLLHCFDELAKIEKELIFKYSKLQYNPENYLYSTDGEKMKEYNDIFLCYKYFFDYVSKEIDKTQNTISLEELKDNALKNAIKNSQGSIGDEKTFFHCIKYFNSFAGNLHLWR
jgi:hypothetical protein